MDRIKKAYPKGPDPSDPGGQREVARSITVHGDAVIATTVHIESLQTRVTNKIQAEALSHSQAAELSSKAQCMATEEEPAEAILAWLASKFGMPGYLSIPAAGFDAAMTYLEAREGEHIRHDINLRGIG